MKVAIYFFVQTHYTFLEELFKQIPGNSRVDLFCSKAYRDAESEKLTKKYPASLWRLLLHSKEYDVIIVDEVTGRYLLFLPFFRFRKSKVYLVVHNLRSWLEPKYLSGWSGFFNSLMRRMNLYLFQHFIVVGTGLKQYGQTHSPYKSFYFVPFGFQGTKRNTTETSKVQISLLNVVVPGTISRRRNYERVLKAIEDPELSAKIRFVLLGKPEDEYGLEILRRIKQGNYSNVVFFETFIPEKKYNQYLQEADILMSDFDVAYQTRYNQTEIYGLTKETGISFLLLSHAKPGILPGDFQGMEELNSQTLRFNTYHELKALLIQLYEHPEMLKQLREEATHNRELVEQQVDLID